MAWLRSALISLGVLTLVAGAIWLFWGKSIEDAWKAKGDKPKKIAREAKAEAEKQLAKATPVIREQTAPLKANVEKAKTGVNGIIEHHVADNRRGMTAMASQNDKRWMEILRRKPVSPAMPATPAAEKAPAKKPIKSEAKPKPVAPRP